MCSNVPLAQAAWTRYRVDDMREVWKRHVWDGTSSTKLTGESCYRCFYREHIEVQKWTKQVWIDYLERGSDKNIFQYCLDSYG